MTYTIYYTYIVESREVFFSLYVFGESQRVKEVQK